MIIYRRGERSDPVRVRIRYLEFSGIQYKGIETVRVFLHFGSGSGILCTGSDILDRVWIFKF